MAYAPQSYEEIILQLTHIAVTRFTAQTEAKWFVYCEADTGTYYPVGQWFASVDAALTYGTCLEDRRYTLDELRALSMPTETSASPTVAPSVAHLAIQHARAAHEVTAAQRCPQCGQMTNELLMSATGLRCPACYDEA